jgi:anhydro-N-acetylmuramic acid kinase
MRANDMELGGQGAPLVPAYHRALAGGLSGEWADEIAGGLRQYRRHFQHHLYRPDGDLLAFDSGPGNALIDQWVNRHAGIPYDSGGAIASEGRVLSEPCQPLSVVAVFHGPGADLAGPQ